MFPCSGRQIGFQYVSPLSHIHTNTLPTCASALEYTSTVHVVHSTCYSIHVPFCLIHSKSIKMLNIICVRQTVFFRSWLLIYFKKLLTECLKCPDGLKLKHFLLWCILACWTRSRYSLQLTLFFSVLFVLKGFWM